MPRASSSFAHALLLFLFSLLAVPASGQTLPAGFSHTKIAEGLSNPTAMALAPDGRLFVCEQGGQLRVIENGSLLPTSFLTVPVDSSGERGLLGVAFDPSFVSNHYVYIYYTVPAPEPGAHAHNRVSQFMANGNVKIGNEVILMELEDLSLTLTNHNGGALGFGLDQKLYISVGDNANSANSQMLSNRLGKILRINSDGTIPSDNPFVNQLNATPAIWAFGLRNPFSFAFQLSTGRMFINDVGEGSYEEINEGLIGANYGWPTCEGPCSTSHPELRNPLYYYAHPANSSTQGCAITSGAFYNPSTVQFPSNYLGKYFFVDLCGNWMNYIDPTNPPTVNQATVFAIGLVGSPVAVLVGPDGSLIYLSRSGGQVSRISYAVPSITTQPASLTVSVGKPASFSVAASGATPLSYQWQRNEADIPGANETSYTIPATTASDNGARFRCKVSNSFGEAISNAALLTVRCKGGCVSGSITATPNPIIVCDGTGLGSTTLNYTSTGATNIEIHLNSPSGTLVPSVGTTGSVVTGKTVSDGTRFYLQNVSGGLPLTSANTLATVRVRVKTNGCP
jgi:glucose/arabinose dehydrogenase